MSIKKGVASAGIANHSFCEYVLGRLDCFRRHESDERERYRDDLVGQLERNSQQVGRL